MNIPSALVFAGLAGFAMPTWAAPESAPRPSSQLPGNDIDTLIRQLDDGSFRVREKATRELWELGETALPALMDTAGASSPEQAFRARELLRKIQFHITPETDPAVIDLVDRYFKASPSEKVALLGKMKARRAWHQMLKLYGAESHAEIREKLASDMTGIAVRAARERLFQGDAAGAREFLEMAPADAGGLLALAEFHRSHGTLDAELERAKATKGRNAMVWLLALQRAAGNLQAARDAANAAGESRVAAVMSALAGDPLPWLWEVSEDENPAAGYADLAARRWLGKPIRAADLKPLIQSLTARSVRESGAAMNALFLLGEVAAAEPAFVKSEPLSAFIHFESLERIPEALKALGLDPEQPDYPSWVGKRLDILQDDDIEDQHEVSSASEELVAVANFLERRGLHEEAFDAFSGPLAKLAENDPSRFEDLLGQLFGNSQAQIGAPLLAKRIGLNWAGEDDRRWTDFVAAAFDNDDQSSIWWDWLEELDSGATRVERFAGMLALYRMGPDPAKLYDRWLALAWAAVEVAPEGIRNTLVERISDLAIRTGDVANGSKAWERLTEGPRKGVFWGQQVVYFSALERWNDAAAIILKQIEAVTETNEPPGAELHAYAAAALRRAGLENEAATHDAWVDKLALGNPVLAMRIGHGYAYGCDYKRAGEWWARAAREADPDSAEFALAMKLHADELMEQGRWKEAAAVSEVVVRIYASSDYRWSSPLPFMRLRLQSDMARALAGLGNHRTESIALLAQCHRTFVSDGSLADFFFPALRKVGLIKEHDRWFRETWDLMEGTIRKYPESDNTRNTAAWFASRARLKLDAAEKYLAEALVMNPCQPAYLDTMAEIQFARGHRTKALEWSKLAVNFAPDDPQLRRQQERFRRGPLPAD